MDEKKVREVIEDFKEIVLMSSAMGFDITSGQCDLIIEALEKQLPKKPNFEGDGYALNRTFVYDTWICPNCDMYTPAYVAKEEAIKAWNRRVK